MKEREVWREERTSFAFVHSTELGLLKADDIELKRLDQVAHNITFVSIAQTTHIPGEETVRNSACIHLTHNPHLDTNRDVSQGRARGRAARAPAQGPYFFGAP